MKKEKKESLQGKPWKIVAKCETYADADNKRDSLLEKSEKIDVKIKYRSSDELFAVKVRKKGEKLSNKLEKQRNAKNRRSSNQKE